MKRLPWDQYFLNICKTIALRSIDVETKIGAVIANRHHRIVSTGYNAFPAGVEDDFWPRERGSVAKVPHVSVPRFFIGIGPFSASTSKLDESARWREEGKSYDCDKYWAMCHAEENAIVASGQDLHGCTLYTLLFPCHQCAKLAITAGISRVVYEQTREDISWAVAKELFVQAKVRLDEVKT